MKRKLSCMCHMLARSTASSRVSTSAQTFKNSFFDIIEWWEMLPGRDTNAKASAKLLTILQRGVFLSKPSAFQSQMTSIKRTSPKELHTISSMLFINNQLWATLLFFGGNCGFIVLFGDTVFQGFTVCPYWTNVQHMICA